MRAFFIASAIALATFAFWPDMSSARSPGRGGGGGSWGGGGQKWGGSFGGGQKWGGGGWSGHHHGHHHHGHHHGHHHHGHWQHGKHWYPGYTYGYSGNYVTTPAPYVVASPLPENAAPGPSFSGAPIRISNPSSNNTALSYTLNGTPYTIQPGQSQQFVEDRAWTIEFSRGANLGSGRYSLQAGDYSFGPTGNGWELFSGSSGAAGTVGAPSNPPPPSFQPAP